MQTQEKPQYASMEHFLQTHQEKVVSRSEFEKILDDFDVLLKRHQENDDAIRKAKVDIISTGEYLGLKNESLQIGWGGGEPERIENAKPDPRRAKLLSNKHTIDLYSMFVNNYNVLIAERKDIENSAKLFIEHVINDAHSEDEMRKLFFHINKSGDYRLAEILHNERIKSTVKSNLLRLKVENTPVDKSTTETLPQSPMIDNEASNLTTSQEILQHPANKSDDKSIDKVVEQKSSELSEHLETKPAKEEGITITSITDIDPEKVASKDTVSPDISATNSTIVPIRNLSQDTAFSKDTTVPIKDIIVSNSTEAPKDVRVETSSPDLIVNNIQTYSDPIDKSLASYAEPENSQSSTNYVRIDTRNPLSVADNSIQFGFGQTPTKEANANLVNDLLQTTSRGDDSKDLVQNMVPPKRTELVSVEKVLSEENINQPVINKSLEKNLKDIEKLTQENHAPVELVKFKPNGDEIKVNVENDVKSISESNAAKTFNEVDHFQNKINELKARVTGNNIVEQNTTQQEHLNSSGSYGNIFASPTPLSESGKAEGFFGEIKQQDNVAPEKPVIEESTDTNPKSTLSQPIPKPEINIPVRSVEVASGKEEVKTSQSSSSPVEQQDNNNKQVNVPLNQPQENSVEKEVLTESQRKQSKFGALLRRLTGLTKNPEPNSQQAHEIAQLREEMISKE